MLLEELSPSLGEETFVVCTLPEATYGALASTRPLASIREDEGLTLVLSQSQADAHGLAYVAGNPQFDLIAKDQATFDEMVNKDHPDLDEIQLRPAHLERETRAHGVGAPSKRIQRPQSVLPRARHGMAGEISL